MASGHEPGEVTGVSVHGGRLAVEVNSRDTEPVLAIHGLSSQRKLWNWLRAAVPGLSLIAPDLRGRGDSVEVALSSSIGRHAEDMVLIMNDLGLESAHVRGMSMGGFVAVELASEFPGRVKSLILVDGGFPMAVPPGLTPEALSAMFASRLARMNREFMLVMVRPVSGVDHAASIMCMTGARATADLIAEALGEKALGEKALS